MFPGAYFLSRCLLNIMDGTSFIVGVIVGLFLGLVYVHTILGSLRRELAKLSKKEEDNEGDDSNWWKKGDRRPDYDD